MGGPHLKSYIRPHHVGLVLIILLLPDGLVDLIQVHPEGRGEGGGGGGGHNNDYFSPAP